MEAIASDVLFGIAKKINRELEELPLQTHGTILSMLNAMAEHRQISMKVEAEQRKQAIADKQMEMMEAEQKRQAAAVALKASGLVLA